MNKIIFYITLLCNMFILSSCTSECPAIHDYNTWITSHFGIEIPFTIEQQMIIDIDSVSPPGFIIIKASETQIDSLLAITPASYHGWTQYKENTTIGFGRKSYRISGEKNKIIFNRLITKYECDRIEIFIDKKKELIIFHWGYTSGI